MFSKSGKDSSETEKMDTSTDEKIQDKKGNSSKLDRTDDSDSERTETDRSSNEESESESENSPKEQKEKPRYIKPSKDWSIQEKLKFMQDHKKHAGIGAGASYLDKVYWSPNLKTWLYYYPDKSAQIIANINRRLIRGSRKSSWDAPATTLSQAGLLVRTGGPSFAFLTQNPTEKEKNPFIQDPDDFLTKFLGMNSTKENLEKLRNEKDLSKIVKKGVSVEDEAIERYTKLTKSLSPVPRKESSAHKRKREDKDEEEKALDIDMITPTKRARTETQHQAKAKPKKVQLTATYASFFSLQKKTIRATTSIPIEPEIIDKAAEEAKQWRLQNEAKKRREQIEWIVAKLDPSAWSKSETGTLKSQSIHPTSASLTPVLIKEFCKANGIHHHLRFQVTGCVIKCIPKTKDTDVMQELAKLHREVLARLNVKAMANSHSSHESASLGLR